ncbi:MAG: cation:proton antiporter [candidate division NC10 bacterium]|nr:cation:proton antiporter [candidate division NC10 bacterium]
MIGASVFFRDLAYVLLAAVLGGGIARIARQPLILGYVLGGILVSPLTPGPAISEVHTFELFAEIGVILLMFSIGIDFSIPHLRGVKWVAVLGGPLGILLSMGLGVLVGRALAWPARQGLIVGIVVSVASTMVLARLLIDRGELRSLHGRVMIGLTLVEDLAVVVLVMLMPALGAPDPGRLLAAGGALATAGLLLVPGAYVATRVVPPALAWVARTRSHELFLLVVLALGLGTAALTQALGLSLALGAFFAGLLISGSEYAHEAFARLLSLRDAFVAIFFVTLGTLIDPRVLGTNWLLLGVMVALILFGKLAIWTAVVRLFGYPLRTAALVAVGLTQIGEFSFILVQAARGAGHVGPEVYTATLAASLLTILLNAILVRLAPRWIRQMRVPGASDALPPLSRETARETGHVILCGFGRVGSAVGEALETAGVRYVVVETDPDIVAHLRLRKVPCIFGSAAEARVLEAAGVAEAALVILTPPDTERVRLAIRHARALRATVPVLARAHRRADQEGLLAAGATEVILPEVEGAAALIQRAMRHLTLPEELAAAYVARFREAMEQLRLAESPAHPRLPEVLELSLPAGSLADRSLRDARLRERFGVTVVAITRRDGTVVLNPPADTVLRPGDRVRLFGLSEQLAAFRAEAEKTEQPT